MAQAVVVRIDARWKAMTPDMTPGASAAPQILVCGEMTSTKMTISMVATKSWHGISYRWMSCRSDSTLNGPTEPGFVVSLYCT